MLDDGRLVDRGTRPVEKSGPEPLLDQIEAIIDESEDGVRAVGIGLPSVIEFATGRVRHTVNLPLHDVPLRSLLTERTGRPVFVENDASCAALAEAFEDGELVCAHLVMLTLGTGVGGGLVLDGRLYRGATGAAAELGHTVIGLDLSDGAPAPPGFPAPGSLEALAAGTELDRLAVRAARPPSRLAPRPPPGRGRARSTGTDLVAFARQGDPASLDALRILGERLGIGVANAINTLDPLEVVIGGGVSAAGELLLGPAREVAARYTLPGVGTRCTIRLARHGVHAGVLGAALIAAQEYRREAGTLPVPRARPRRHGRRGATVMAAAGDYEDDYLPIAEHGLVGDLHTVALVGTNGTIDWYCVPAFDSPSVFGVDPRQGPRRPSTRCGRRPPTGAPSSCTSRTRTSSSRASSPPAGSARSSTSCRCRTSRSTPTATGCCVAWGSSAARWSS